MIKMSDPVTVERLVNADLDVTTIEQVTMNDGYVDDTTTNRDGVTIDTLEGRLKRLGWEVDIPYAGGISFAVNDRVKTVNEGGNIYSPKVNELPFTTSGAWVGDDDARFQPVQLSQVPVDGVDTVNIVNEAVTLPKLDASLQSSIAQISTNTGNISTNAGNISTNTGNIATNTASIASIEASPIDGYIFGIDTSSSDGDTVDITVGKCADSTGAEIIDVAAQSADIKNRISAGGNLAGSAAPAINSTYFMFVVSEADGSEPRIAFDLLITAGDALSEWSTETGNTYTLYRLIGFAVLGNDILPFSHTGDDWLLGESIQSFSTGNQGTSASIESLTGVPDGVIVMPKTIITFDRISSATSGTAYLLVSSIEQSDSVPSSSNYTIISPDENSSEVCPVNYLRTNSSRQIRTRLSSSNIDWFVRGQTFGWSYKR